MRLLLELSGEHPTLPFAELECIGRLLAVAPQVAVVECESTEEIGRLALAHYAMAYIGECPATREGIAAFLSMLEEEAEGSFSVRARRVQGAPCEMPVTELERLFGAAIGGSVDLSAPEVVYRIVLSGGRLFLGRVIAAIDRSSFEFRNPLRRPFFHPGVMLPRFARAMVNISLVRKGELLLDPCCGTGGMLLEGMLVGARVLGGDADPAMIRGTLENLPDADAIIHDACEMPLKDSSIDAVVTDLPYGQSVSIFGRFSRLEGLYSRIVEEIVRVLRNGRRAVIVSHMDIRPLAPCEARVIQFHEQRIHRSLTRRIMVLERQR